MQELGFTCLQANFQYLASLGEKIMEIYPIVYVRGYAMTTGEVEDTFNMPYYGFEVGATQYKLGSDAKPDMHIFESPVVRLIEEEHYVNSFNRFVDTYNVPKPGSVKHAKANWRATLWIFRFYDPESALFGSAKRPDIEDYAEGLGVFLAEIRSACSDGSPEFDKSFKVNLVAHSMGGLVTRCYLQNTGLYQRARLKKTEPVVVNKLFTYGTPHRGIAFRRGLGWAEDVRDFLGISGSDTFGEREMRKFLSLDESDDLHVYKPARTEPPVDKIFCLVGTNYKDYVIWVSKKAVGPGSDGLVAIENAYVKGSGRAYVHRAHSGPFGLVNSEEGYQNLIRFLFGDIRYEISLCPIIVTRNLPGVQEGDELEYLEINVDMVIRGLATYIHTRRELDQSSIAVPLQRDKKGHYVCNEGTHLFTGFLRKDKRMEGDDRMRLAVQIRIIPHYKHVGAVRESRFEGESILNDRLHVGVRADLDPRDIMYRWGLESNSDRPLAAENMEIKADGSTYRFPLPQSSKDYMECDAVIVKTSAWN
jgi:hypothetical protein